METRGILDAFASLGIRSREMRVTGGYTRIPVWNRILADVCGMTVTTLKNPHASLAGAAVLAWVGTGRFPSPAHAAAQMLKAARTFLPEHRNVRLYRAIRARYDKVYDGLHTHEKQT